MKKYFWFGICCLPVGLVTDSIINFYRTSEDRDWLTFKICVAIVAILSPSILWYVIIEHKDIVTIKRGATVGVLSVFLAHFLSFYFFLVIGYFKLEIIGNPKGVEVINPFFGIVAAATYAFVSLLLFGLFHLPIGALIG
ncbi:MAG TPA: hypothetical protein EYM47_02150 [Candidatus Marinimicrobia bacterium]|nr:hypothetical protein [Candidatus Neomarinimicrobiota bacterium]